MSKIKASTKEIFDLIDNKACHTDIIDGEKSIKLSKEHFNYLLKLYNHDANCLNFNMWTVGGLVKVSIAEEKT